MANEKLICNQICTWNDPSDGCVKPNGRICPMSSAKVDVSRCVQVKMANEKRPIDVDSLISQLEKMESYNCSPMYRRGYDDCISAIKRQMIVDAVEVVRCGECRFCKEHPTSDKVKMCANEKWNTEYYPLVHDDDFCSYGERR